MARLIRGRMVLAFVITALIATSHGFARQDENQKKSLEVKTSEGTFKASVDPDPAHLKLPIYPGAQLEKRNGEGGLDVSLKVSGKPHASFVVAKYGSKDHASKVVEFYKKRLGRKVTRFVEKSDDGSTVFEIKSKMDQRYVSVKSVEGRTRIELVHVEGVEDDGD